ncbi:MAG: hypothetical protein Q9186_005573 [Xanthomendoza sp. 1 TL-2023]
MPPEPQLLFQDLPDNKLLPDMSAGADGPASGKVSLMERFSSRVTLSGTEAPCTTYNFLSFLATAQARGIQFLPTTWQWALGQVGEGGTSRINHAPANKIFSMAYKRVINGINQELESDIFRSLITEITILSLPGIREHPNIVQLHGICWDVLDSNIWPVLVFQKSESGDLFNFLRSPAGKALDWSGRLTLCVEIARAVIDMHSLGIIHGDLKPQNVLIFQDHAGTYSAKVIDFGYSTQYADDEHLVRMPISRPWNAPEHTWQNQKWTVSEARPMDAFSFGILCLWVLFEKTLSGATALDEKNEPFCSTDEQSTSILEKYKVAKELLVLVRRLVDAEDSMKDYEKHAAGKFFNSILSEVPMERDINPGSYSAESNCKVAFQLALCYKLGFGVERAEDTSMRALHSSRKTEADIEEALDRCSKGENHADPTTGVRALTRKGHLPPIEFGFYYLNEGNIEEAKSRLKQEITDLQASLGDRSDITLTVKCALSSIWVLQKRWEDAEKLQVDIVQTSMQSGMHPHHPSLLAAINNLAYIYQNLGDRNQAEKLLLTLKDVDEQALDAAHLTRLTITGNLAGLYRTQERWDMAEQIELQALEISMAQLGPEHPSTLANQAELAWTYKKQRRWYDAERLEFQTWATSERVIGKEHPHTLTFKFNLAYTLAVQHRYEVAETLSREVVEGRTKVLGVEHPDTRASMDSWQYIHTQAVLQSASGRPEAEVSTPTVSPAASFSK